MGLTWFSKKLTPIFVNSFYIANLKGYVNRKKSLMVGRAGFEPA